MKTESGKEKRMVQELDLLKKYQKISVKELAETLRVSEMTVRRDLELLRKNHVLERSYGYATLVEGGNGYSYEGENYDLRRARLENFAEKDRIAKYAASLIRPDDWVFLDNGTTVSRMTFYLPTDFEYTVLCYNFLILAELLKHSNIKVIFPGGYYHPEDYNFTSPEAVEFIRRHRANKAFLSVSGVHQSLGITCINANIVENKKAMIESSAQNISWPIPESSAWSKPTTLRTSRIWIWSSPIPTFLPGGKRSWQMHRLSSKWSDKMKMRGLLQNAVPSILTIIRDNLNCDLT